MESLEEVSWSGGGGACVVLLWCVVVWTWGDAKSVVGSFCCLLAMHLRCVLYTEEIPSVSSS